MRRYIIGLAISALLVGSLFRAADETGVRLMRMFGTLGILIIGVIGTMALTRYQSRQGLNEVETALKSLEPDVLITDWVYRGGGRPDYLLIGPGGIAAILVEEMPQSTWRRRSIGKAAAARRRALSAADWVRAQLPEDRADQVPVHPTVVLTRKRVLPEYLDDGVRVVNSDQLVASLGWLAEDAVLDRTARIELTKRFRGS